MNRTLRRGCLVVVWACLGADFAIGQPVRHGYVSDYQAGLALAVSHARSISYTAGAGVPRTSAAMGQWAGVYRVGGETKAIRLQFSQDKSGIKGSFDMLPRESDLPLEKLHVTAAGFTAVLPRTDGDVTLTAQVKGTSMQGTARKKDQTGALELIKLASVGVKTMRSYEGMYRNGDSAFLIEHLGGDFFNLVELPSGEIRNIFPVGRNEFIAGPTLMESLPVEKWLTFVPLKVGPGFQLLIRENGERRIAARVSLRQQEVSFRNGDVTLAGTLILRSTPGRHPAIIFMHGSGQTPRTSYFGLGYWLASKGFAVLKYDKRGSGDSTGDVVHDLSYEDLADDAIAGAHLLQSRSDIDPRHIGFWGASEGAWTAPLAAARYPEAGFVIAASGGGLSPAEQEIFDSENQLRSDGRFSETDIQEALAFQRARDRYMKTGQGWEEYAATREKAVKQPWYGYPTTDLFGPAKPDSMGWKMQIRFYFYDPAGALKSLRCPFLNLRGAMDDPLSEKPNIDALNAALADGKTKDTTIHIFPNSDHMLFEAHSSNDEDLPHVTHLAPGLFSLVTEWLERVTR